MLLIFVVVAFGFASGLENWTCWPRHKYATAVDIIYKMNEHREIIVKNILYELWFSVAESIFKRVCEVTELDAEQIEALKAVALRPNDFQIEIE